MLTNKNLYKTDMKSPEFSQEIKNSQEFSPLPNQRKILKKVLFWVSFFNYSWIFLVFFEKKFLWDFFFSWMNEANSA